MSDLVKYGSRFVGANDLDVRLEVVAPKWMHESRIALAIEHVAEELKRHVDTEHPGPDA